MRSQYPRVGVSSSNRIVDWFALLARAVGLEYHFLIAGRGDAWRRHFTVNLAALEDKLAGICQDHDARSCCAADG